jgi:hypothetical protein
VFVVAWHPRVLGQRNIVRRYAREETGSEQGFGIGEKFAHHCVDRSDYAAFDIAGRPQEI